MSHTPGPWGWTYDGSSDYSIGPAVDPQCPSIARIWDRNNARGNANAALISAAPDLLAALKDILRVLPDNWGDAVQDGVIHPLHLIAEDVDAALAAIAKAEGRS